MKKYAWIAITVLAMGTASFTLSKSSFLEEEKISKNISFAVYKGNNYSSKIYNNASAQLKITIEKVRGKKRTVVWEKTYDEKLLKHYPDFEHALTQEVTISNLVPEKEHLEVVYTLLYNANGSALQMQNGAIVSTDCNEKLNISI